MNGVFSPGTQSPVKASVNTSLLPGITSRYCPLLGNSCPSGERIVILLPPPARRSISASGVVHGLGANTCLISSGSVQQR